MAPILELNPQKVFELWQDARTHCNQSCISNFPCSPIRLQIIWQWICQIPDSHQPIQYPSMILWVPSYFWISLSVNSLMEKSSLRGPSLHASIYGNHDKVIIKDRSKLFGPYFQNSCCLRRNWYFKNHIFLSCIIITTFALSLRNIFTSMKYRHSVSPKVQIWSNNDWPKGYNDHRFQYLDWDTMTEDIVCRARLHGTASSPSSSVLSLSMVPIQAARASPMATGL